MIDWATTAFVFPGQASQVVGMGKDIADVYPIARDTFAEADDVLGYALSRLCFEGPESDLNDTYYTQPALYVCSIATLRALQSLQPDVNPSSMAGHSLGELTAFAAAGAYGFADGLRLVQTRGRLMKEAGVRQPGAMAAVIGLDREGVDRLCERAAQDTGAVLVAANDNCPGQIVISGDVQAVERAAEVGKSMGARMVRKLPVSIASHSPLMQEAADQFQAALESVSIQSAQVPVYANGSAQPVTTPDAIRSELAAQLTHPVRWTESIAAMSATGVRSFVEVGPKDVLSGLIKRIVSDGSTVTLNTAAQIADYLAH